MPTSPGRLIHEDLKTAVKKPKKVVFAAVADHTYPPPLIVPNVIPTPRHLSTKTVENHKGWTIGATETDVIKRTVHQLTDHLLDTTQCYSKQAQTPLLLVHERALEMHPVLHEFENEWATRCIIMAHLKAMWSKSMVLLFLRVAVDVFSPSKVRAVGGPQREVYDQVKDMEAYHKEQAALARQKHTQLASENQYILAQLQTAQKLQAEQTALNNRLYEDLERSNWAMADMQRHEGQLEAQFIGDQEKLQAMGQVNTMSAQLLESQKLLMQQNNEVQQLSCLLDVKQDEAIQLRALNHLGKKKPQNKPPPCRGTRTSLDPVCNSSTRTIEIPLDPIPMTGTPNVTSNPKPKRKLNLSPALANLFGTDVDTLAEIFGKLVPDDIVTVSVEKTTSKVTTRKNRNAIQPMDNNLKKHINTALRSTAYVKFNVTQVADFQMYNPAEADKVAACEEDFVDPQYDLFQWDFGPVKRRVTEYAVIWLLFALFSNSLSRRY
ncbi:hypothetical protein B0H16DRAFT_1752188 [Mycena metata]|uniref:Uncharacterized protein n=1 Tax=Mycena metata TaxID=1033252 RepID=A0AAD7DI64_9AGAR|nr:hypothetical protein B0H16DRAFT_1752188 [Mycena metata]